VRYLRTLIAGCLLFIFAYISIYPAPAYPNNSGTSKSWAEVNFGREIIFHLEIEGERKITRAWVELGFKEEPLKLIFQLTPHSLAPPLSKLSLISRAKAGDIPAGTIIYFQWCWEDIEGEMARSDIKSLIYRDESFDWQVIESDHFYVYYPKGKDKIGRKASSSAERVYRSVTEALKFIPPQKINIYLYISHQDYMEAVGRDRTWEAGSTYPEFNLIIIKPVDIEDLLHHEFVHVVFGQATNNNYTVPAWFNEGLATYLAGEFDFWRQNLVLLTLVGERALDLYEMSDFSRLNDDNISLAYAQSYKAIEYLVSNYGEDILTNIETSLAQGNSFEEALKEFTSQDIASLDRDWMGWLEASYVGNTFSRVILAFLNVAPFLPAAILVLLAYLIIRHRRAQILRRWEEEEKENEGERE